MDWILHTGSRGVGVGRDAVGSLQSPREASGTVWGSGGFIRGGEMSQKTGSFRRVGGDSGTESSSARTLLSERRRAGRGAEQAGGLLPGRAPSAPCYLRGSAPPLARRHSWGREGPPSSAQDLRRSAANPLSRSESLECPVSVTWCSQPCVCMCTCARACMRAGGVW